MNDVTDARVGIIPIVAKEYKDGVASGSELPDYADSILVVRRRLIDASLKVMFNGAMRFGIRSLYLLCSCELLLVYLPSNECR
jgi:hypothetical protein